MFKYFCVILIATMLIENSIQQNGAGAGGQAGFNVGAGVSAGGAADPQHRDNGAGVGGGAGFSMGAQGGGQMGNK